MSMAISVSDVSPAVALRIALKAAICLERIAAAKATPAWQRDAEDALSAQLVELLRSAASGVIDHLVEMGYVPGDPVSRATLLQHIHEISDGLTDAIANAAGDAAQHGRDVAVGSLRAAGESGISFDTLPEHTRNLIRDKAFEASTRTMERITGDVMSSLTQSFEDGVGIDEAARRLRDVFDGMEQHELVRVARTEIISAQNQGTYTTLRDLGVDYHEWLSAEDDRTRESHLELNGQIVRVGDPFSNGLYHPGDTSGAIEEWINCRCRVAPFLMPEGKTAPPGQPWFYASDLVDIVQEAA